MRHLCPSKRAQEEEEEVRDKALLVILKNEIMFLMNNTFNRERKYRRSHIVSHMLEGGG